MTIGVLAIQGDFAEHIAVLRPLGVETKEVRSIDDLRGMNGLIIPGGESTVISRFLKLYGLDTEIIKKAKAGFAVFGTCAGSIVIAKKITGGKCPNALGLIDMEIDRNAYGTQTDSFETDLKVKGVKKTVKVSFIRAPVITKTGKDVEVLSEYGKHPVIIRQGKILASTCHPEMRGETAIHKLFIEMIR